MKREYGILLRWLLAMALLWKVERETGIWTFIALTLLFLRIEIGDLVDDLMLSSQPWEGKS